MKRRQWAHTWRWFDLENRCAPRLIKRAAEGIHTADLLQIIGDQGDREMIEELERFRNAPDAAISEAARESIQQLRDLQSDNNG